MDTWENGAKGSNVKKIIDGNFDNLDIRLKEVAKQATSVYIKEFTTSDWTSGVITIKYSEYNKLNPCVELYIKDNNGYSVVFGGYTINDYGIDLQSDMAYEGKVVIR